jgi:hypothetical protein
MYRCNLIIINKVLAVGLTSMVESSCLDLVVCPLVLTEILHMLTTI